MEVNSENILKFLPPTSFVHSDFWYKLADIKLHIDKLNDSQKDIRAFIGKSVCSKLLIEVDCTAFNSEHTSTASKVHCNGILLNKNTVDEFKSTDKNQLIKLISNNFYEKLLSREKLNCSSELILFMILSFADFKTHKYYYWFAFPVQRDYVYICSKEYDVISSIFSEQDLNDFETHHSNFKNNTEELFYVYDACNKDIVRLSDLINHSTKDSNMQYVDLDTTYFCCIDYSIDNNPSWLLRQFLGYVVVTCPRLWNQEVKCICVRSDFKSSILHTIKLPRSALNAEHSTWIGWEVNENGKFAPRLADMSKVMDPMILAERSINLNLTLMKWRLLPDLDLDIISKTKYLLLGAGTLGCGVARSLLAWGAQRITFVDSGKVSLSNPVRQNLFLYEDAINGGKLKAATAAERLKQINPCVVSSGLCLQIPMPGHTIGESQMDETIKTLGILTDLIKTHDIIYLLTDSRESRWLPTMLAAFYGKMAINAALGFDSFLVMRHGSKTPTSMESRVVKGYKELPGFRLGCYFCNDIVAPGNSLKDRTLDQQCTVTRPAVSNIASSLAVELSISLLQHKYRDSAPAYYRASNSTDDIDDVPEEILGIVPHSIRGHIGAFNYLVTATEKFSECIACSEKIMEKFEQEGNRFIIDVINSSKILEDVAGISKLTCSIDEEIDFDSDIE